MWTRRSQCECDQVGTSGRYAGVYCAQKDAYETDQTAIVYGAETLATTKRQENGIKV